jgi:hypothetical protein
VTDDLDALVQLDRALDEPAAARAAGEAAVLTALAAELRATVPDAPRGAAARGRAALLASAAMPPRTATPRRSRFARARVLAAALVLAVAVPAALAGQAPPGTPLWPLRHAGQQLRLGLTADPVDRAHLRLNTATMLLDAARDAGGYRQEGLAAGCREQIQAALAQLRGRSGSGVAAERARAEGLLADLDSLARPAVEDEERRGPGPGQDDGRSGPGSGGSGGSGHG